LLWRSVTVSIPLKRIQPPRYRTDKHKTDVRFIVFQNTAATTLDTIKCLFAEKEHRNSVLSSLALFVFRDFSGIHVFKKCIRRMFNELNTDRVSQDQFDLLVVAMQVNHRHSRTAGIRLRTATTVYRVSQKSQPNTRTRVQSSLFLPSVGSSWSRVPSQTIPLKPLTARSEVTSIRSG
jgi:hypothetical protein